MKRYWNDLVIDPWLGQYTDDCKYNFQFNLYNNNLYLLSLYRVISPDISDWSVNVN